MAGPVGTAETILVAAQRSIRARGRERLSMSAVAAEAGVSRPTLYRWFPTKTLLLAAIASYQVEQFDLGLRELCEAQRDPAVRLDAALMYLVTYLDDSMGADSVSADPAFALQTLADSLTPHIESLAAGLGDALDEIPSVRTGIATRAQAAEMLLRVAYSHYLVPNPDTGRLVGALRAIVGLPPQPGARRRSRRVNRTGLR
jgi:AcrR family transcriptional regulator